MSKFTETVLLVFEKGKIFFDDLPSRYRKAIYGLVVFVCVVIGFLVGPRLFIAREVVVSVPFGVSTEEVLKDLENKNLITSLSLTRILIKFYSFGDGIVAGDYAFSYRFADNLVAWRLVRGSFNLAQKTVTFPEGFTAEEMGERIQEQIPEFNVDDFMISALPHEGFLFPDTYHIGAKATPDFVVSLLRRTFDQKTDLIRREAQSLGYNFKDVVIMASLIEKEVNNEADRKIVSGILWKRLNSNMRLQVDAPFLYILGKSSETLTRDDLNIDSPFNTYRFGGLPPSPIANPGLEALDAAIHPEETRYLFYLTGKDGKTYYAQDLTQHLRNKELYID